MTTPTPIPELVNAEALVSAFLRDQAEMVDLVADRVYTVIPKPAKGETKYPLVLVSLIIDTPHTGPLWGVANQVQVDAFGGSKDEALRIAWTARALMSYRLAGVHANGIVNGVTTGGLLDLPDEGFTPAKPRFLFSSTVHTRPLATVSPS